MKIFAAILLGTSLSAFAQTKPLPVVKAPKELTSGQYSEGTVTRLTQNDVASFIPWAQNAQNTLKKALKDSQLLPISERLPKIEYTIKSVVQNSGSKNYQLFMRFALNRGLMLSEELKKQSNFDEIGVKESSLDILVRSIDIALSFYESDLSFQTRAQQGNTSVTLNYADFGKTFFSTMLPAIQNVHDASAEFKLAYKLFEMVNWDLSRDAHALDFSDQIVEIYQTMQMMQEEPSQDDLENLKNIRRLMVLESLFQGTPSLTTLNYKRLTGTFKEVSDNSILSLNLRGNKLYSELKNDSGYTILYEREVVFDKDGNIQLSYSHVDETIYLLKIIDSNNLQDVQKRKKKWVRI